MNIILWIIFGAIAGWVASIIMKTNASQGTMMDVVMGIIGACVVVWVGRFLRRAT